MMLLFAIQASHIQTQQSEEVFVCQLTLLLDQNLSIFSPHPLISPLKLTVVGKNVFKLVTILFINSPVGFVSSSDVCGR